MYRFRQEVNPLTGATESYYWDDQEKKMTVRVESDVTDIIEANKRQQNTTIDGRYGKEMFHKVADIPNEIAIKWKRELGVDLYSSDPDMKKKVLRLLNDPEWRYLKTTVKTI